MRKRFLRFVGPGAVTLRRVARTGPNTVGGTVPSPVASADGGGSGWLLLTVLLYYVLLEGLTGRTIGKLFTGIRVVDAQTGGWPGVRHRDSMPSMDQASHRPPAGLRPPAGRSGNELAWVFHRGWAQLRGISRLPVQARPMPAASSSNAPTVGSGLTA